MFLQLFHLFGQTFQVVKLCKLPDWLKTLQIGTHTLKTLSGHTKVAHVHFAMFPIFATVLSFCDQMEQDKIRFAGNCTHLFQFCFTHIAKILSKQ